MENKRRTTRGRKRVDEIPTATAASPSPSLLTANNINMAKKLTVTAAATASPAAASAVTTGRSEPTRRASPARSRTSPVRRSSRPRSTVLGASAASSTATVTLTSATPPSHVPAAKEPKPSPKSRNNLPTTLTTNTSSRAPGKATMSTNTQSSSSMHSSYSSNTVTTQKTIEIRGNAGTTIDAEVAKLTDYLRRSVSKTFNYAAATAGGDREGTRTPATTTDQASRYSRSVSQSVYNDDGSCKAEFSEDEDVGMDDNDDIEPAEHYKSFNMSSNTLACRQLQAPREFGGPIGCTALMLLVPSIVYYLQWCCSNVANGSCKWQPLNLGAAFNAHFMAKMFSVDALAAYLLFNMGMFVLSALTFGRHVRLPSVGSQGLQYNFNALPIALLLAVGGSVAAAYLKYPIVEFVLKHQLRFCAYSLVNAFIVSLWAYCRASYIRDERAQPNVYGKSGSFLADVALGRQINPKWFGLVEFKQVFQRISLMSTLLLGVCLLCKSFELPALPPAALLGDSLDWATLLNIWQYYQQHFKYEPAALLAAFMLCCYAADAIIFEHHLASSFELQGEGFGALLLLRYAATPFLYSAVAKHLLATHAPIKCQFAFYLPLALFFTGLFIKRLSSAIKYKYRIDPNNDLFYRTDTIHTFQGRRLLLGAFWGTVRQPNYAGDILAMCALAMPIFLQFAWPPLAGILLCIAMLLHRTRRVNARNTARYHSSWVRYCMQVRQYILPKIF